MGVSVLSVYLVARVGLLTKILGESIQGDRVRTNWVRLKCVYHSTVTDIGPC